MAGDPFPQPTPPAYSCHSVSKQLCHQNEGLTSPTDLRKACSSEKQAAEGRGVNLGPPSQHLLQVGEVALAPDAGGLAVPKMKERQIKESGW